MVACAAPGANRRARSGGDRSRPRPSRWRVRGARWRPDAGAARRWVAFARSRLSIPSRDLEPVRVVVTGSAGRRRRGSAAASGSCRRSTTVRAPGSGRGSRGCCRWPRRGSGRSPGRRRRPRSRSRCGCGEQLDELELRVVGVLELVDQDVPEPRLRSRREAAGRSAPGAARGATWSPKSMRAVGRA